MVLSGPGAWVGFRRTDAQVMDSLKRYSDMKMREIMQKKSELSKLNEVVLAIHENSVAHVIGKNTGRWHPLYFRNGHFDMSVVLDEMALHDNLDQVVFMPRHMLEENTHFRQPISYVVVTRDNKVLVGTRTKASGDSRIHSKRLLGFGGHVALRDAETRYTSVSSVCEHSARREIYEELGLQLNDATIECLLYNNSNPVDAVHLGLISILRAPVVWEPKSKDASGEHKDYAWLDKSQLAAAVADGAAVEMESWGKIIAKDLLSDEGLLPRLLG